LRRSSAFDRLRALNPVLVGIVALAVFAVVVLVLRSVMPPRVTQFATLVGIVDPVLATVFAMSQLWGEWMGWRELGLLLFLFALPGLGVTVGYHRLLTHRSFETGRAVKTCLLVLGAMGIPSRPTDFAATHLEHHANSDRPGDPHSPLDGFLHAHAGWLLDMNRTRTHERYCRRLLLDPAVAFVERTAFLWFGLGFFVIPFAVAGWSGFLWGGLVRMAFGNHLAYAVNSICHRFGSQPFRTGDESRNNFVMGLLAFGEGWHNNHHAFPAAAYHGMGWRQPDLSGLVIRLLVRLGLAWDVKEPNPGLVERKRSTPVSAAA
jgi:stearoyl-CoA desaturase (delta-9 desaturase)